MFFLYSFLLTVGFLVFLPRFLFQKKYRQSFRQRLGHLPDFDASGQPVAWLHCVSVGEAQAARPLFRELCAAFPDYKFVVSTTTVAGQKLAREIFAGEADLVFYFPFDWRFTVRRALSKIKPDIVLLMETELWFNFVREAGNAGARVVVVNGRLSETSARRYGWIRKTMRRVLRRVDTALMQTNADAKRLLALGIRTTKIKVTGNVKFDWNFSETENKLTADLRARFDISDNAPLIVAASTHAPEEKYVLDAFKKVYKSAGTNLPRLLIAPRHPERFAEVEDLIKATGFDWAKRTEAASARDQAAEIILLDTIGELRAAFPLAEIVFVGGSLTRRGGQNVLEPAAARKAVVTGVHTENFKEIVEEFLARDAIIQLPNLNESNVSDALAEIFAELLRDRERRETLAANAFQVVAANRGATARTIEQLKPIFESQNQALNNQNQTDVRQIEAPRKKKKYYKTGANKSNKNE